MCTLQIEKETKTALEIVTLSTYCGNIQTMSELFFAQIYSKNEIVQVVSLVTKTTICVMVIDII